MKFPMRFSRTVRHGDVGKAAQVAASEVALGSDSRSQYGRDCLFLSRPRDAMGYPLQRIVVGCSAPEGSPSIPIQCWLYEDKLDCWFLLPGPTHLEPGMLHHFDPPTLMDNPIANDPQLPGALEVLVQVGEPERAPDGLYRFVVGADVSSPGC